MRDNQITNLVRLNTTSVIDREIYEEEYSRLTKEIDNLRKVKCNYLNKENEHSNKKLKLKELEKKLKKQKIIDTFDEELFRGFLASIIQ